MDTTNKHLGNILSECDEKDLKEVFEQFIKKEELDEQKAMFLFENVLSADSFDQYGGIKYDQYKTTLICSEEIYYVELYNGKKISFKDKKEMIKYLSGEFATDRFGDSIYKGYDDIPYRIYSEKEYYSLEPEN